MSNFISVPIHLERASARRFMGLQRSNLYTTVQQETTKPQLIIPLFACKRFQRSDRAQRKLGDSLQSNLSPSNKQNVKLG